MSDEGQFNARLVTDGIQSDDTRDLIVQFLNEVALVVSGWTAGSWPASVDLPGFSGELIVHTDNDLSN